MTTLFSWLSVDNRGPSAIYIVSDSRITWGSPDKWWDSGRKVFAMKSADVLGYCGEVLFPSLVLGQLSDLIDRGLLWPRDCAAENRHSIILEYLKTSFERRHNAPNHDFTIIHCAREGDGLASKFHAHLALLAVDGRYVDDALCAQDGHGDLATARAAALTGVPMVASTLSVDPLESVAVPPAHQTRAPALQPRREKQVTPPSRRCGRSHISLSKGDKKIALIHVTC